METNTSRMIYLNGCNYKLWKGKMEDLLYVSRLHQPVFCSEKPEHQNEEKWNLSHRQVCAYIRQWVDENVLKHVSEEVNARTLWNKLEQLYAQKTCNDKLFLIKQLKGLRYRDGTAMSDHLIVFQGIINELFEIGIKFNEEVQGLWFLGSLPDSWETFRTSLLNSALDGVISMELVRNSVLNEEMKRKLKDQEMKDVTEHISPEEEEMLVPHSKFAATEGPQPIEVAPAEAANTVDAPVVNDPPSATFIWTIENFSRLTGKKVYSDVFVVGGYKWRVLMFPKGNKVDHLSMYLDVADSTALPYGWSRYALFGLAVVNQIHSNTVILRQIRDDLLEKFLRFSVILKKAWEMLVPFRGEIKAMLPKMDVDARRGHTNNLQVGDSHGSFHLADTIHQFNAQESDWGFTSFMPLSELYDPSKGYLLNDTCIVEAHLADTQQLTPQLHESAGGLPSLKLSLHSCSLPGSMNATQVSFWGGRLHFREVGEQICKFGKPHGAYLQISPFLIMFLSYL
ncbi:putative RNA-directed DNA polymerase [Tanacetum coccineum]